MKTKYVVVDEVTVDVYEQAQILGFIDLGSETVTRYVYDNKTWDWRNSETGERVKYNYVFTDLVEKWKWRSYEAKRRQEFLDRIHPKG